jgi:hypothetical protein
VAPNVSYLFDVPEAAIGLANDPSQNENTVTYVIDRRQAGNSGDGAYAMMTDPAFAQQFTLTDWEAQFGPNLWNPFAATATAASYAVNTQLEDSLSNPYNVKCASGTTPQEGGICQILEYFSGYQFMPSDTRLAGTPVTACGFSPIPQQGQRLCFNNRNAVLQILNLPVPGGALTQTLSNTCPFVDVSTVAFGSGVATFTVPATAVGVTSFSYWFVCTQTVFVDSGAQANCAAFGPTADITASPPVELVPGATLEVAFPQEVVSSGAVEWQLWVYTVDPATSQLAVCRVVNMTVTPTSGSPPYVAANLTIAPVFVNDEGVEALNAFTSGVSSLAQMAGSALVTQDAWIAAVEAATVGANTFSNLVKRIANSTAVTNEQSAALQQYDAQVAALKAQIGDQENATLSALAVVQSQYAADTASLTNLTANLVQDQAAAQTTIDYNNELIANDTAKIIADNNGIAASQVQINNGLGNLTVDFAKYKAEFAAFEAMGDPIDDIVDAAKTVGEDIGKVAEDVGHALGSVFDGIGGMFLKILMFVGIAIAAVILCCCCMVCGLPLLCARGVKSR